MFNFLKKKQAVSDFESLSKVAQVFLDTTDFSNLVQEIVDRVLIELGKLGHDFHIGVLALVDPQDNVLKRTAISRTKAARDVQQASETSFKSITTPLTAKDNHCIAAMEQRKHFITHSYRDILHPPFSFEECDSLQEAGGVKTSVVFPVIVKGESIGIVIFSTKQAVKELTKREVTFIESLAGIIGIAVEDSNLFEALQKEKSALERANKRLQELDRTKDEFISVASHELRTPMTVIKGYLWMITTPKGGVLPPGKKEYVKKAQKGVERMLNLINDMLNVSRIEQNRLDLKIGTLNLKKLLQEVVEEFKIAVGDKKLYMNWEDNMKNSKAIASVDEEKFREVLVNLVGNAVKFTEKGGVTVRLEEVEGDKVKISVIDTGPGIREEDKVKLFRKFSRVDNSYSTLARAGGTGLGLYITKSLVERMGGSIGFESEFGKGSTFWVIMPKVNL